MEDLFAKPLSPILETLLVPGKAYAGIGSRKTSADILTTMRRCARFLGKSGMVLRSGGADGADAAFEAGCDSVAGQKEIFLPNRRFNGNPSPLWEVSPRAFEIAERIHPGWNFLSSASKRLHARNCNQILGENLDNPVAFVVFWAPLDKHQVPKGGTRTAVVLAHEHKIPCVTHGADGWYILSNIR